MTKIAMVVMGGHGHVNPTLALAEELKARGHDVVYCTSSDFASAAEHAGVAFHSFDSPVRRSPRPTKPLAPNEHRAEMFKLFLNEATHTAPLVAEIIEKERPDFVLYDSLCLGARLAIEMTGVRAGVLFTSYAGNDCFNMIKELGELSSHEQAAYDALMTDISARFQTKPFAFANFCDHAESCNIVFMPRLWQYEGQSFDERYAFVGPCFGSRMSELGSYTRQKDVPTVLISLGTAFNRRLDFYQMCFEAFGGKPVEVVMALGSAIPIASLGVIPDNFVVSEHVPQLQVLKEASAFITHGGMNSTMEALQLGVPLIVFPQMSEQALTAKRVAMMGVGLYPAAADISARGIWEGFQKVVDHADVKKNIERVRAAIAEAGSCKAAGDFVEAHLRAQGLLV